MKLSLDTHLDQKFMGRHRVERVQNSEVTYVRYLDRIGKTYDYFLYVVSTLPQSVCVDT